MNILYDERLDGPLPDVNKADLLKALQQAIPDLDILWREEELKPYECDGLSAYRTTPMLVALPRRLEQVQTLLKLCHQQNVPVVARGAGTVFRRCVAAGKRPVTGDGALQTILHIARPPALRGFSPACAIWRFPGRRAVRAVLRAGSIVADRLFDWRQRRRNAGGVHCLKYA